MVCASTPSADLKPYDSEYTGYMGNYGNTMDHWYRRAAVVVWPRQNAFAARAEASPSWALTELKARLDTGDLVNAQAAAESVAPFWKAPGPGLLEPALHTAAGLEDPGIALMLLRPFAVEWVAPAHAGGLTALAARYGRVLAPGPPGHVVRACSVSTAAVPSTARRGGSRCRPDRVLQQDELERRLADGEVGVAGPALGGLGAVQPGVRGTTAQGRQDLDYLSRPGRGRLIRLPEDAARW